MGRSLRMVAFWAGPLVFVLLLILHPFEGMPHPALAVLAGTSWIAIWWITEVVPIPVTSLLPMVLFPLSGAMDIGHTTAGYGNKLVYIYVGGFLLALAIEKWNLHKRIALNVIRLVGTSERRIILGFMLATAFLSMWISNTATSVMMLPIGMAIVLQLLHVTKGKLNEQFGKALMLGIAYAASLGGISTLIGTPPNLVLSNAVSKFFHQDLIFSDWFFLVFPLSLMLVLACWLYLTRIVFRIRSTVTSGARDEIEAQLQTLGKMAPEERRVLVVFAFTAFLWIFRSFLLADILPALDDTIVAIIGGSLLFVIPSGNGKRLMEWNDAMKLPWGIVLLFGGGLAIADGFKESGLADWIGGHMQALSGAHPLVILFIVVGVVNFLTEITSNVATTAMILPVLAPLSANTTGSPLLLMVGATLAASCAFMLPVATPPNAVVFGSGYLKMGDMIKAGFGLNLLSIMVISLYLYFMLPVLW